MTNTRATATVLGATLTLGLVLTGCASRTTGAGSSSSAPNPASTSASTVAPATTTVTATATATPAVTPAGTAAPADKSQHTTRTALGDRLLTRRDLPAEYDEGAMRRIDASALNTSVRACLGVTPSTGGVVVRKTTPTFSHGTTGVASTVASYRTQKAVTDDAAVLTSTGARRCLKSAVVKQFANGASSNSTTIEVRPGTNDGPANEAGVVGVDFVVDEDGRGSRQTVSVSIFYLTGPKVLAQLIAVAYGQELDAALLTGDLLTTIAKRTAQP